jgi:hypothetical protein
MNFESLHECTHNILGVISSIISTTEDGRPLCILIYYEPKGKSLSMYSCGYIIPNEIASTGLNFEGFIM